MTNKLIQLLKIKKNTTVRMRLSVQSSASAFAIRVTSSDCSAIALAQSIRSLFDPPSPLNDWKKFKRAKMKWWHLIKQNFLFVGWNIIKN